MKILRQGETDNTAQRIAVIGMFDGVHCGHKFLIESLHSHAIDMNLVPTVITFSNHPLAVIAPHLVPPHLSTIQERISLLSGCGVDACLMLDFDDTLRELNARQFMEMVYRDYGIRALLLGFNTRFGSDNHDSIERYCEIGKDIGITVIQATEYGSGINSSAIRGMVADGDIENANRALGYHYSITGVVVKGKQLGRTIGFPTANIEVDDSLKLIPANGVYAVDVTMPHRGDTVYRAMLNIGRRPTVDVAGAPISIEAHIMDLDEDLYGLTLNVEFLKFIRPERAFASLEELKCQLANDRQSVSIV